MTTRPDQASGKARSRRVMRAAVIVGHGQPPQYRPHPAPARGPGQALIRVTAAPVSPLDLLCASGTSYFGAPPVPYAPGVQGVGIIEESDTLPTGQRVWFSCDAGMRPGDGALAELCVTADPSVLPLADGVSDEEVAALGLSAIAAWMALTWRAGLRLGERVLVLGASGTVGQVGVQSARLLGAGRVIAACRDAHGRARATALGADAVADLSGDDVGVIAETADKVAVMYASHIVEYSKVDEIFHNPLHPYTVGLLGSIPKLHVETERLMTIEGTVPSPVNFPVGCNFNTRCAWATEVCYKDEPALLEHEPGHFSACHHWDKVKAERPANLVEA